MLVKLQAEFDVAASAGASASTFDQPLTNDNAYSTQSKDKGRSTYNEASAHEMNASDAATNVRDLASQVLGMRCGFCGERLVFDKFELAERFGNRVNSSHRTVGTISALNEAQQDSDTVRISVAFPCRTCDASTCLGCGESMQQAMNKHHNELSSGETEDFGVCGDGLQYVWHCDQARIVHIWFLLCGFDRQASENESTSKPSPLKKINKSKARSVGVGYGGDTGVGYGGASHGGYGHGYGSPYDYGHYPHHHAGQPSYQNSQTTSEGPAVIDPTDEIAAKTMAALTTLLPSFQQEVPSSLDFDGSPVVTSMLLRSSILEKAAKLLRNDSLEDVTSRGGLYEGLISFVQVLSSHPSTNTATVHKQRILNPACYNILHLSMGQPVRSSKDDAKQETAQPLASCLANLRISAMTMVSSANSSEHDFQTRDSQQLLYLCQKVCELADSLDANAANEPANNVEQTSDAAKAKAMHEELGMMEVPDEILFAQSVYGNEARGMNNAAPGRMRQLAKELTRLKTGLPEGIFVRYGSLRPDLMKILVVGPKGTPYENGLWEFDLLCRNNFPNEAPVMSFRTTGGGVAHVNPNLYQDGKVCLSLLGTWSGEPWKPGVSTLLQVLVSIQAMTFCDEPHCNEPSFEKDAGSAASKAYNRNVYIYTVKYAMLEWLGVQNRPAAPISCYNPMGYQAAVASGRRLGQDSNAGEGTSGAGVWSEVVKRHFAACSDDIIKIVDGWVKDTQDPSSYNYPGARYAAQMYGAGVSSTSLSPLVDTLKSTLKRSK